MLKATGEALALQGVAVSGAKTLLRMNQPEGFDCPGCAWPDPKHTSSFEFCENGAKAVAWEATASALHAGVLRAHTFRELTARDDYELERRAGSRIRWPTTPPATAIGRSNGKTRSR